jgi:hypothetical protein
MPPKRPPLALAKSGRERVEGRQPRRDLRPAYSRGIVEQFVKVLNLFDNLLGNGVTVAQQTLTLFVLVRIQVPQPARSSPISPERPLSCRSVRLHRNRMHRCGCSLARRCRIDKLPSPRRRVAPVLRLPTLRRHAKVPRQHDKGGDGGLSRAPISKEWRRGTFGRPSL